MRKLAALLLLIVPAIANAWWNDEWNFRKELTLDLSASGANISGSPAEVAVLVRLHLGNFGYFADTLPDGADLRFVAGDDKTPLKFHVERYDVTNNLAFVWVKVPRLAGGGAERIFLYYGNKKAPAGADAPGTYDAAQALVYHFEGDGAPQDTTAYANNASASTAEANPASLIGGGVRLTGAGAITVPSTASLRVMPDKGTTFSTWIRIEAPQADAYVFEMGDANRALLLAVDGTRVALRLQSAGQPVTSAESSDVLVAGQWHHVAVTASANRLVLFVDGVEIASTPAEFGEIAGTLTIGGSAGGGHFLTGEIDEVEVSNVARPLEWLQAAVRSQGQEALLVIYGNDAQKEGGEEVSYFAVTMKNVTVDGWVVIIILAVMFVVAVLVIVSKAVFLSRVRKANRAFLKEFERLRGDPTALDQPEGADAAGDDALDESPFMPHLRGEEGKYRVSTLYRLYHHGVQEMTGRIGLTSAGARAVKTLTPQAMEAIRATMDATLVRMTQKLASQMVLLTIAISGGPFLGLLGTVVGVMITFAAIAASGDVNVNSIAPGIAAALAATVAGLVVAIPALFAYNWLNITIKEINADMRVFVDEFVTRVAEHYS